jgi:hypothetical protein
MINISVGEYCSLTKTFFVRGHNMEADRRMNSKEAKIIDLIGEHLQTKEKIKVREGG